MSAAVRPRSVALVASSFLPRVGGVEEHVRHLAAELAARGHRVSVWAVDRGDPPADPGRLPGVTVRYLPAPLPAGTPGGVARFAAALPAAVRAWERARRADRPDVLHVQCFGPNGTWATVLAATHRVPLVVGTHGETFMDDHRVLERSALQRRALRAALRRAEAVTACSAYARDDLRRFGPLPDVAEVVGNGVDAAEPAGEAPRWLPGRTLVALGRLVEVKGFDLLLRAYAAAGTALDGVSLVVAGDGPARASLQALADELGLGGRVVLPGALDRREVVAVLARAEALVVPSRREAFGIVVLEGMRAGIPVVATSADGVPEVVTGGVDGLLVDPTDAAALADALVRVTGDARLRCRLGEAGAATAAAYTWQRVADRVEAVYRRLA